jgi:hypothetical protein
MTMTPKPRRLMGLLILPAIAALSCATILTAQNNTNAPMPDSSKPALTDSGDPPARLFDDLADKALLTMRLRAEELKIKGVAVVAYIPGTNVNAWSSKMLVVGHLKTPTAKDDPGSNLLAIAYSKASEMAETLKPSGTAGRPVMKGEVGWQGGWIIQGKTGYILAAFSGGRSEDDVNISKTGLEVFSGVL